MKRLNERILRPGDIILTTGGTPVSKAIRFGTGSEISHAMVYVEAYSVIDATAEGVQSRNTQRLLLGDDCAVHALRLRRDLTSSELNSICSHVRSQIGTQYSVKEAVRAGLGGKSTPNRQQFCSRLVAQAYAAANIPLVLNPHYCTPEELRTSQELEDLGPVTVPVSDEEIAYWGTIADIPQITRDATNAVLAGARQRNRAIESLNDIIDHLIAHPEDDDYMLQQYEASGYLSIWKVERDKSPWQYDLRLMNRMRGGSEGLEHYCRTTVAAEQSGPNRYVANHAISATLAATYRLKTFAILEELYGVLASLHQKRVEVATRWLKANNIVESIPTNDAENLVPNSTAWLDAMATWNPVQAEFVRTVLRATGRTDVCSLCGDDPAADYRLTPDLRPPAGVDTLRLCDDCVKIRVGMGEIFVPLGGQAGSG